MTMLMQQIEVCKQNDVTTEEEQNDMKNSPATDPFVVQTLCQKMVNDMHDADTMVKTCKELQTIVDNNPRAKVWLRNLDFHRTFCKVMSEHYMNKDIVPIFFYLMIKCKDV